MKRRIFFRIILLMILALLLINFSDARRTSPYPKESSDGASIQLGYEHLNMTGVDPWTGEDIPLFLILREDTTVDNPTIEMDIDTLDMEIAAKDNFLVNVTYFDFFVNRTTQEKMWVNITIDDTLSKDYTLDSAERTQTIILNLKHHLSGTWVEIRHLDVSWIFYHITPAYLIIVDDVTIQDLNAIRLRILIEILFAFAMAYMAVRKTASKGVVFDLDYSKMINYATLALFVVMVFGVGLPSSEELLLQIFNSSYQFDYYVIGGLFILFLPFNLNLSNQHVKRVLFSADRLVKHEIKHEKKDDKEIITTWTSVEYELGTPTKLRLRLSKDGFHWLPKSFRESVARIIMGSPRIKFGHFLDNGSFVNDLPAPHWVSKVKWYKKPALYTEEYKCIAWHMKPPKLNISFRWWILGVGWLYASWLLKSEIMNSFDGLIKMILEITVVVIAFVVLPVFSLIKITGGKGFRGELQVQPEPKQVSIDKALTWRELTSVEQVSQKLVDLAHEFEQLKTHVTIESFTQGRKLVQPIFDKLEQVLFGVKKDEQERRTDENNDNAIDHGTGPTSKGDGPQHHGSGNGGTQKSASGDPAQ